MNEDLIDALRSHGPGIVFGNVLLEQLGLPVPAVPTLIVAGTLAASGQLPGGETLLLAVGACLIADFTWYAIGRRFGLKVLRTLCRISLEPDSCVSQTQTRFERWGVNSLLIAKFVPGLSIIAPPLAGAMRLGWLRFAWPSAAGATLWAGSALFVGALFEPQIERLLGLLNAHGGAAVSGLAAAFAGYLAFKWWERRRFLRDLRMARIDVHDLHALIESGAAPVIVDVRSPTALALQPQTIPGALRVPVDGVGAHVRDLPRDRDIVLYCACPNEASAARVARILKHHGFARVRPLAGGLDAWIAAGYASLGSDAP